MGALHVLPSVPPADPRAAAFERLRVAQRILADAVTPRLLWSPRAWRRLSLAWSVYRDAHRAHEALR